MLSPLVAPVVLFIVALACFVWRDARRYKREEWRSQYEREQLARIAMGEPAQRVVSTPPAVRHLRSVDAKADVLPIERRPL